MNFLSEYHPIRFGYLLKHLIADVLTDYANSPDEDQERLRGLLLASIYEHEVTLLFDGEDIIPHGLNKEKWAEYKEEIFGAYISYMPAGENIFHIQHDLLQMFIKSSVKDIELSSLNVPFPEFYMYFGEGIHYPLSTNSYIDGAYINFSKDVFTSLFIYLTQFNSKYNYRDPDRDELAFLLNDDHLYYLLSSEKDETIGALLKEVLPEIEYEIEFHGDEWKVHLENITNLIINCLCFLSSPHNDLVTRFPTNTPKSVVKKIEKAITKKAKATAIRKIKCQGFHSINF